MPPASLSSISCFEWLRDGGGDMVVGRVLSGCVSMEGRYGVDKGGGGSGVTINNIVADG